MAGYISMQIGKISVEELQRFLRRFAIYAEKDDLMMALRATLGSTKLNDSGREGEFFRMLASNLGKDIDLMLCREMERSFRKPGE